MPLVEKDAEVTLVVLVYRSLKWLDWVMEGVERSKNSTRYRWMVVANDATDEVRNDPRITVDWQNEDTAGKAYPDPAVMAGIYKAWNIGIIEAPTQLVCCLNSDMVGYKRWLDGLILARKFYPKSVPTSLLVESGRIPSAMPEWVKNCGTNPDEFDSEKFDDFAEAILIGMEDRESSVEPGRLYMPILFDRQEFIDRGMYPEQGNPPGTTGDKDLIRRYTEAGFDHVTAVNSICYHVQCGETQWP